MRGGRGAGQAGFVITLELVLILTLLVVGLFAALAPLWSSFVTYLHARQARTVVVFDAANVVIGRAVGYNGATEGPQVIFRDVQNNLAVLLEVRPLGFVTTSEVYHAGCGCTGAMFVDPPGTATPGILDMLQGRNYSVGLGNIVYKDDGGGGVNTPFSSVFSSGGGLGLGAGGCTDDACCAIPFPPCPARILTPAVLVQDMSSLYATPYKVVPPPPLASSPGVSPIDVTVPPGGEG